MPPKLVRGEPEAWAYFFEHYARPSLAFLTGALGAEPEVAQDILQKVVMRMLERDPGAEERELPGGSLREKLKHYPVPGLRFRALLARELKAQLREHRDRLDARREDSWEALAEAAGDGHGRDAESSRDGLELEGNDVDGPAARAAAREVWTAVEDVLDVVLGEGDARKRKAYRDWLENFGSISDDEIAARHGLKAHQFKYLREVVAKKLSPSLRRSGFQIPGAGKAERS